MIWLLTLAFAAQSGTMHFPSPPQVPPAFPDGLSHVGAYTPNTQLLAWCTSEELDEVRSCDSYIAGVLEASGMIDVDFPRGPIDTSKGDYAQTILDLRSRIAVYIEGLPNVRMSGPAARSVYDALVAAYPYEGRHREHIPYRPITDDGEPQ